MGKEISGIIRAIKLEEEQDKGRYKEPYMELTVKIPYPDKQEDREAFWGISCTNITIRKDMSNEA